MTNRQRFFFNGIILTVVGIAIRSVSLGFNSFITKNIGAEGIGLFTLIGTVYSFAVTFATSGISLTVTRLVSSAIGEGKEGNVRSILRSAIAYSLIFSVAATSVLFCFAPYFGNTVLSDQRCVLPLRILALSLVPIALSSVFCGYFVGVKRVAHNAVIQVLGQIFKITVTAFLVLKFAKQGVYYGIIALSLSMALTEIGVFLFALIQFIVDKKLNFTQSSQKCSHFNSVRKMAVPLALSAYIRSALLTVEHILIPRRLRDRGESHSESLKYYGILHGMALPMLLYPMAPLSSFSSLLVPEFSESAARHDAERMKRVASEALNTTLAYSIGAMTLLLLLSEEIGYVIYDSYDAGYYIALMAPILPIMYLDHVADSMLKGIGEHVFSMWVNISDSLLSVILVWVLIPALGISGYAIVIVVMEGYNFLLSVLRLRSKIKFKLNLFRYGLLPLLAAFASAALSRRIFLPGGAMTRPVWFFLEILFAICLFFGTYLSLSFALSGILNKTDRSKFVRDKK